MSGKNDNLAVSRLTQIMVNYDPFTGKAAPILICNINNLKKTFPLSGPAFKMSAVHF
jgi:hypothetical protein